MRKDLLIENTLAPSEQEQLLDWLETSSHLEVKQRLAKPRPDGFGFNASITTLHRFLHRAQAADAPELQTETCEQARALATPPEQTEVVESAALNIIRRRLFHDALSGQASPRELEPLFSILLKLKEDARDERKLKLLEDKAACSSCAPSPGIPAEFEEALRIAYSPRQE